MLAYMILVVIMGFVQAEKDYTNHRVISATATNKQELHVLWYLDEIVDERLDLWTVPSMTRPTAIRVPPNSLNKVKQILENEGIAYQVSKMDVQALIDKEKISMGKKTPTEPRNITDNYLRYNEIETFVYGLQSDYPDRVRVRRYGKSYQNRDLLEVKIASDLNHAKQAIWIEANTHSREWLSVSTGLHLMQTLASGTPDGDAMLAKYDWYITPTDNPDGYEYSHTNDRMWRKNRERHGRCCIGTDLNRNWAANFGGLGSSDDCTTDTYNGGAAFSAPEIKALNSAILETPNVFAFFSIHTYGQELLLPYSYTSTPPADYDELKSVGEYMMAALKTVNGLDYNVLSSSEKGYILSGSSKDYFYDIGIKYSYLFELRPETRFEGGFIMPTSEILPVAMETIASLKAFTELDLD